LAWIADAALCFLLLFSLVLFFIAPVLLRVAPRGSHLVSPGLPFAAPEYGA
jgi:hypothetical protein